MLGQGSGDVRGALQLVVEGATLQRILAQVLLHCVQPRRHVLPVAVALAQVWRLHRKQFQLEKISILPIVSDLELWVLFPSQIGPHASWLQQRGRAEVL